MAIPLTTTAKTFQQARKIQTRVRFAAQTYATAYRAIGSLLIVGTLDVVLPLPNWLRGLFIVAWLGYIFLSAAGERAKRRLLRRPPPDSNPESPSLDAWEAQIARAIEQERPELDNALIHAVQFGGKASPDPLEASLIQRELERAEREAANLPVSQVISRAGLERSRRFFLAAAAVLLATLLFFPRAVRFEFPRLFLFWQDHPPFTLTDFSVSPGDARARNGESLTVTIRVGGLIPDRLELVTEGAGEKAQSTPLAVGANGEYAAQLENLSRDTAFYVNGNTGRSRRYQIEIDYAPRLRRITAAYRPPAYTNKDAETSDIAPEGEIRGLRGTAVRLEVEADQPLSVSALTLTRDKMTPLTIRVAPKPDNPRVATADFTIERDGEYDLTLIGGGRASGLKTEGAARGKVALIHDEKPIVTFLAPGQNVMARPDMTMPLLIEALDDVALQRLEFHRIINKGRDTAETIELDGAPREFRHPTRIDLKALGAKPGDVIEYYATAYDNDPQGIHNADSDRYWIWVLSAEDYRKVLAQQRGPSEMQAQYTAQTEALRSLAEQQKELAQAMAENAKQAQRAQQSGDRKAIENAKQQTETLRQRQGDLRAQAQEAARQMRELANQPPQFDIEKGMQKRLQQMANAVEQAMGNMQSSANAPSPNQMTPPARNAAQQLQKAAEQQGANIEKTMHTLQKTLALYNDLARLQALAKEQAKVAQQAEQTRSAVEKGKSDEFTRSRLKSLGEQQAQLEQTLAQIQQDLKEHAADAQTEAPNAANLANKIADALASMQTGQKMQEAGRAMQTQDAGTSARRATQAQQDLESLFGECKQGQQAAQGACNLQAQGQLGMGAGNSLAQLSQRMGLGMPGTNSGGNPGQGQGTGQSGQGGQTGGNYSAPTPGSRPGDSNADGTNPQQQAMAMALTQQSGGGTKPQEKKNLPGGERIGTLAPDSLEKPDGGRPAALPKATDRSASRYPAEYRRLVQEYFKSVAGGK